MRMAIRRNIIEIGGFMRSPKEQRPVFFSDPANDRLAAIIVALSAEVSAIVDRFDTMETLLTQKGVLARGEIDNFPLAEDDAARRRSRHEAFMERVFYVIRQEFEALE